MYVCIFIENLDLLVKLLQRQNNYHLKYFEDFIPISLVVMEMDLEVITKQTGERYGQRHLLVVVNEAGMFPKGLHEDA